MQYCVSRCGGRMTRVFVFGPFVRVDTKNACNTWNVSECVSYVLDVNKNNLIWSFGDFKFFFFLTKCLWYLLNEKWKLDSEVPINVGFFTHVFFFDFSFYENWNPNSETPTNVWDLGYTICLSQHLMIFWTWFENNLFLCVNHTNPQRRS